MAFAPDCISLRTSAGGSPLSQNWTIRLGIRRPPHAPRSPDGVEQARLPQGDREQHRRSGLSGFCRTSSRSRSSRCAGQRARLAQRPRDVAVEREFVDDLPEMVLRNVQRLAAQDMHRRIEPDRGPQPIGRTSRSMTIIETRAISLCVQLSRGRGAPPRNIPRGPRRNGAPPPKAGRGTNGLAPVMNETIGPACSASCAARDRRWRAPPELFRSTGRSWPMTLAGLIERGPRGRPVARLAGELGARGDDFRLFAAHSSGRCKTRTAAAPSLSSAQARAAWR